MIGFGRDAKMTYLFLNSSIIIAGRHINAHNNLNVRFFEERVMNFIEVRWVRHELFEELEKSGTAPYKF